MIHAKRLFLFGAVGATALAIAGAGSATPSEQIQICHGTASATNPYVLIRVDEHALAGHFDGTAPGHGDNNQPDFIAANGNCDTPPGGGDE